MPINQASKTQLAAILFSDIVDYSALMQRNRTEAVDTVDAYKKILEQKVASFNGQVLNDYGDGNLSIFNSATDAVRCAMEMQIQFRSAPVVPLRIGIHVGEIVFNNGQPFGDGVNIASRIESLGQAGTVFFSKNVYDKIRNLPEFETELLGQFQFKNIDEPEAVYALANQGFPVPKKEALQGKLERDAPKGFFALQHLSFKLPVLLLWVLLFSLLSAFLAWQMHSKLIHSKKLPVQHFQLVFPEDAPVALGRPTSATYYFSSLAISPEGNKFAFIALKGTDSQIYLRSFDQLEATPLEGTEGATELFFSPDGNWIGFFSLGKLKKRSLLGGQAIDLLNVEIHYGAIWTEENEIIFYSDGALRKISADGGLPELLFENDSINLIHPAALPDKQQLLVNDFDQNVFAFSLKSGKLKKLLTNATSPRYLPTGHLAFIRQGSLMGVSFDPGKLQVKNNAFPLINNLRTESLGRPHFTFANNGTMLYVEGTSIEMMNFVWADRNTRKTEALPLPVNQYGSFDLSPDDRYIAYALAAGLFDPKVNSPIEVVNISTGQLRKITIPNGEEYYSPIWSPDGKWLAFAAKVNGVWNIYRKKMSGAGEIKQLSSFLDDSLNMQRSLYSWSPDHQYLAFTAVGTGENWLLSTQDPGKLIKITPNAANSEAHPAFSPDSRFIAFSSGESGNRDIFVRPFPLTGEQWMLSSGEAADPVWSPLGDELFFTSSKGMFSVKVQLQAPFTAQPATLLFDVGAQDVGGRSFDFSSDGQRFLLLQSANSAGQLSAWKSSANQAVVVTNWFEEIRKLAPN